MNAQQTNMDVISNNLANVDTNGFKKSRADFQDLMYQTKTAPGRASGNGNGNPTGLQIGTGVRTVGTKKLFTTGNFKQTGNPFDIAIEGKGFFQVTMPDGTVAYTRNGSFNADRDGNLVTSDGYLLEPNITVPQGSENFDVSQEGIVSVEVGGQVQQLGTIELANFINPTGLSNIGKNLYKATEASGNVVTGEPGDASFGTLLQNSLETSNVKIVNEMVDMISAQRAYEVNTKTINTADQMLQSANNLKRS
jgi:flagellar basal-body rod protein FlgG